MDIPLKIRMLLFSSGFLTLGLGAILVVTYQWTSQRGEEEIDYRLLRSAGILMHTHNTAAAERLRNFEHLSTEPRFRAMAEVEDEETLGVAAKEVRGELGCTALAFLSDTGVPLAWDGPFQGQLAAKIKLLVADRPAKASDLVVVPGMVLEVNVISMKPHDEITGYIFKALAIDSEILQQYSVGADAVVELRDGDRQLAASGVVPLNSTGWRTMAVPLKGSLQFMIKMNTKSVTAPLKETFRLLITISLVCIVVGGIIAYLAASRFSSPIRNLADMAHHVGTGDLSVRAKLEGAPELQSLARDFNWMVESLGNYQDELIKSKKLETLGVFAGGIAHDFNNILTIILCNLELFKINQKIGASGMSLLVEAERAVFQAQGLTQQLLTFSTGGTPVKKSAFIAQLLRDSAVFAARGSNAICQFDLPDDLWPVDIDTGQISQVITNLTLNAIQAMGKSGVITFRAENVLVEGSHTLKEGPTIPGRYLRISIEDQGTGIDKETLQKIFDPFFTTKNEGSGLGLASVRAIISKHQGTINAESEVGKGTTFTIILNASASEPPGQAKADEPLLRGNGRILIMDDEPQIRKLLKQILNSIGYDVECAEEGAAAVRMYEKAEANGMCFDVVILDLTIRGGLGGKETIRELLKRNPSVKVIASSGYSDNLDISEYRRYGFAACVPKPYQVEKLARTIQDVLQT